MGINLNGSILYIKRSSGIVPAYNYTNAPTLGYLYGSGSTYLSAEDYQRQRENTISKVICVKNMVTMKEVIKLFDYFFSWKMKKNIRT